MISLNVTNVITITLIALVGIAVVKMGLNAVGMTPSWL